MSTLRISSETFHTQKKKFIRIWSIYIYCILYTPSFSSAFRNSQHVGLNWIVFIKQLLEGRINN